ncbi:MAG: hypothetical protein FJZ16_07580 [Candidatus Omnitrophica bacterium]|nr:hypothetical protein [Candidatus Omnitrophota bacterium]
MKIYFLMIDEPMYSPTSCRIFLERYREKVIGVSFPPGILNRKRIISTMGIYGLPSFLNIGMHHLLWKIKGGCIVRMFQQYGIRVYPVKDINNPSFINLIKDLGVDLIISFNCPQVFRRELINTPKKGCINIHFGMLPKYRGIQPIMHAILNGEKEFGVTVHYIDEKLDSGDIILQENIPITERDTLDTLYPKAFEVSGHLLVRAVDMIERGLVKHIYNDPNEKSYFSYPDRKTIRRYRNICRIRQR